MKKDKNVIELKIKSDWLKKSGRGRELDIILPFPTELVEDKNIATWDFLFELLKETVVEELKEVKVL